jgi:hypothetical protein
MLSEALQRNAKHEARLSNISDPFPFGDNTVSMIKAVAEVERAKPKGRTLIRARESQVIQGSRSEGSITQVAMEGKWKERKRRKNESRHWAGGNLKPPSLD